LKKFAEGSGLGISLEGTVDVENGQEVRPHHYIRSILPEGPVGQNGILRSGDELLEVRGWARSGPGVGPEWARSAIESEFS
jgi:multiple PDZ domain protein